LKEIERERPLRRNKRLQNTDLKTVFPTHDCSKIHRAASTSGSSGIGVDSNTRQQNTTTPQGQRTVAIVFVDDISLLTQPLRNNRGISVKYNTNRNTGMIGSRCLITVAACLLCSLAPASAFSTNNVPWMKPLSSRQNQFCGSLTRKGPNQVFRGPIALSMSLDPQLLKSGIAAYGVVIGAGGIVAGFAIYRFL
jgi:hypothetical protein